MEYVKPIVLPLILLALFGTGAWLVQEDLDQRHPEANFEELLYLPSGRALHIAALGFNSPLADAIWLKSLIYFSDNIKGQRKRRRDAKHLYLRKAMEVVTELNPGFREAYSQGGLLLSAAGKAEDAIHMMQRGVDVFPEDWRLHLHIAVIAMQQLKDEARAYKHFRAAANCPGVSETIMETLPGILAMQGGEAAPDKVMTLQVAGLEDTVKDSQTSPQLRKFSTEKLKLIRSQRLCYWLTGALKSFMARTGRLPTGPKELFESKLLSEEAETELASFPYYLGDSLVLLPDGAVTTRQLSEDNVIASRLKFKQVVKRYQKKYHKAPESLAVLIDAGMLLAKPQHPLHAAGYGFHFDTLSGELDVIAPGQ